MVFANRYEIDILLREELDEFARQHPEQLQLHYLLSRPSEQWTQFKGHVNAALVSEVFPSGADQKVFALLCGPPGFIEEACVPSLRSHGYELDRIVQF